jgi:quinol monooxygenase YgiN
VFYHLNKNIDKENEYWMLEEWETLEDLELHAKASHVAEAGKVFATTLENFPPEVVKVQRALQ